MVKKVRFDYSKRKIDIVRWIKEKSNKIPKPNYRIVMKFAILPYNIKDEYRWLEFIYIKQTKDDFNFFWCDREFVSSSDYMEYINKYGYEDDRYDVSRNRYF